ncbi:MAG: hypothetical protein GY841_02850 [FCB group bacterium]|nr:hypothetical protein [FCB group bacterium]
MTPEQALEALQEMRSLSDQMKSNVKMQLSLKDMEIALMETKFERLKELIVSLGKRPPTVPLKKWVEMIDLCKGSEDKDG